MSFTKTPFPGKRLIQAGLLSLAILTPLLAIGQQDDEQTRPAYRFQSKGEGEFGGKRLRYIAIVEETFVTAADGKRTASLVSTSYLREGGAKNAQRPVVFVFNGGPGSAGLWLQMGLVGPRRVAFDNDVQPTTVPPYQLADNTESILDVADVVIFDPPGTGYSRLLPGGKPTDFFGISQDARVTIDFIREWVERHGRWNSPRFLMGESYGTVRAAAVAKLLAGGPFGTGRMDALTLNGVIMLGQALDPQPGEASYANDLASFAATAWYHNKVDTNSTNLDELVADANQFAATEYIRALYAGSRLDGNSRQNIAARLAGLTGLPLDLVLKNNLRVSADTFTKNLLADQGQEVGKYDSRFVLPLESSGNDPVADDPAMGQYVPGFVAAVNLHMRDELGVTIDEPYLAIEFHKVNGQWDYGHGPGVPSRANRSDDMAVAMRRNPHLYLFVGSGYYDLVTTSGAAEYMVAHTDFPEQRVTVRNYASGHMPYLGTESRRELADDLREFISNATSK